MTDMDRSSARGGIGGLHLFLIRTEAGLRMARPSQYGLVRAYDEGCLDVEVSRSSVARALRIMKRLLKSLAKGGREVFINDEARPPTTVVTVDGENVLFRLRESYQRRDHVITSKERDELRRRPTASLPRWDYSPTGILALEIDRRRFWDIKTRWSDGKRHRLEIQVEHFIKGLEKAAQWLKERRAEREKDWLEWEERQRKEEEFRLRRLEEERWVQELKQQVANWRQSQLIKEFLGEVRKQALGLGLSLDSGDPLGAWLAWADMQGDRLDSTRGVLAKFEPAPSVSSVAEPDGMPREVPSVNPSRAGADLPSAMSGTDALVNGSDNGQEKKKMARATLERPFDRTTLYEQVWSQPVQHVAKSYDISGRGLAKACRKLFVPVPPRGYWVRIQHGYNLKKPELPKV